MSRKNFPMSALVSGLLAVPAMGLAAAPALPAAAPQALVQTQSFPAEMPAEVALLMRRVARGQAPDANGMAELQRRLALQMKQKLSTINPEHPAA